MTNVAMATTIVTKTAITSTVYKISSRCLHLVVFWGVGAIERCQTISTTTDHSCHDNDI